MQQPHFLNEIEYAGCGTFTDLNGNLFNHWPDAYYKKAIELSRNV